MSCSDSVIQCILHQKFPSLSLCDNYTDLFLHHRFKHIILNLKGRFLPSLRFGPPEITVPPVSIRYVTHFGSYLSAVLRIEVAMITGTSPGPLKQSGVLYFKLPVGTAGGSALPGN